MGAVTVDGSRLGESLLPILLTSLALMSQQHDSDLIVGSEQSKILQGNLTYAPGAPSLSLVCGVCLSTLIETWLLTLLSCFMPIDLCVCSIHLHTYQSYLPSQSFPSSFQFLEKVNHDRSRGVHPLGDLPCAFN